MALTPRQLNRATLSRQMLLEREPLPVVEAVNRVVSLQAQDPASPYIGLWNRVVDFDPSELDAAYAEYSLVKASLMRITLHAVDASDYTSFHEAMVHNLRGARLGDRRFTSTGLTVADADELVPHLVEFASEARTKAEIEDAIGERIGRPPERGVWWALRTFAPLVHAPTGGTWMFGPRQSFRAGPTDPPRTDRETALQRLAWRYLEGFGPASAEDLAQYALHYRPLSREALEGMGERLIRLKGPDGATLFDIPGAPLPDEDASSPPRLMAMWDNALLGYVDRSRIVPAEYRQLVMRRNGDVLPTLLVDGYVAGVWRPVDGGIEALAFHPLPDEVWSDLANEARGLLGLLADRNPTVYSRHMHWWSTLPRAEVEVLPG